MRSTLYCLAILALSSMSPIAFSAEGGVLVFGGSGRLGAPIVEGLIESGSNVTVFSRPNSNRQRLDGLNVNIVSGDLLSKNDVLAVFASASFRAVIDASARRGTQDLFYATAMANIISGASENGVTQIIYHSSVGAGDNTKMFPRADFSGMRDVLLSKGQAEQSLIDSDIAYTIIRNGLLQPDGTPPTGNARLTEDQGVMSLVTRADLATLTLQCLDQPRCMNHIYHAADDGYEVPKAFRQD